MANSTPEIRFKENFSGIIDVVYDIALKATKSGYDKLDPTIIKIVGGFVEGLTPTQIIETFITSTYSYWNEIRVKDQDFLMKKADQIFTTFSDKFSLFRGLFDGGYVSEADMEILWSYFHSFVKISIRYQRESLDKGRKMETPVSQSQVRESMEEWGLK